MKQDSPANFSPQQQLERPTTTAQRQRTSDPGLRNIDSRASSVHSANYNIHHHGRAGHRPSMSQPGVRLTSLSALYQPAFKPYAFSHMYSTKYENDFPQKYINRPEPLRPDSTNYAPIDYSFSKTTYNQHFQERKPMTLAFVVPYSRHRKNNPQPANMNNIYNYPNSSRWIWTSPTESQERESKSAQGPQAPAWSHGSRNPYPRQHRWYSR